MELKIIKISKDIKSPFKQSILNFSKYFFKVAM